MINLLRVYHQFEEKIKEEQLPESLSKAKLKEANLNQNQIISIFESQITIRHLDLESRRLKAKGLSFYTISSAGHEGNTVFGFSFPHTDMAFLHYRSGGFMLQRARQKPEVDMVKNILLSCVAAKNDPISSGRHKVFGSFELNVPPQTSTIASHLPKAFGAAISIRRAKELDLQTPLASNSIILCSFGDASFNHACSQTTFNAAQWLSYCQIPLPIIFICEDNGLGISVPTPPGWIENNMKNRFCLSYIKVDGLNIADLYLKSKEAEYLSRVKKRPVFLHMSCVRLLGHAGSDIESSYLSKDLINHNESNDPLLHTARQILEANLLSKEEIVNLYYKIEKKILSLSKEVIGHPHLESAAEIKATITSPKRKQNSHQKNHIEFERKRIFATDYHKLKQKRTLAQNINHALTDILIQYENTVILGEDVAHKGGVYNVTSNLYKKFGLRRVFNTILDETTILGTAIGMAHNGFIPIPEIQFLAYLHNAEDQIRGEASPLSFFSSGQFINPMIVRIPGLAYQKGFGGHFHNENSIAVLRDIPGIVIACPAIGSDAVRMLRTCLDLAQSQGIVCIFIEPIALYSTKDLYKKDDKLWLSSYPLDLDEKIRLSQIKAYGKGKQMAILTYANGLYLSRQAQDTLKRKYSYDITVIDIRWLKPIAVKAILNACSGIKKVLIVDECRQTGSLSEELVCMLLEKKEDIKTLKRITAEDCFIPIGEAHTYLLPTKEKIIESCLNIIRSNKSKKSIPTDSN
ncbi:MAG: MFS transporter [Zetaproteobacteria bacterium]|nr:MFS transporter [Pseudobdellovibrionaceae bacterium]